jgi:hypothetical protein
MAMRTKYFAITQLVPLHRVFTPNYVYLAVAEL